MSPTPLSRRDLLRLTAGAGLTAGVAAASGLPGARAGAGIGARTAPEPTPIDPNWPEGIAAGDPRADGAVIWTRVAPPADGADVTVDWEVAVDPSFATVLASGTTVATAAADHNVHADVTGLPADSWYSYRFTVPGDTPLTSRTGRLRTAPADGAEPERLRFVWTSCQQRSSPYTAHRAIAAEEDLDFFMHLGDYIYVSDTDTLTLDDYRGVWRTFRSDPLLQDLHAALPCVGMWDDGEFYNGVDRTGPPARLEAAKRAWLEFMPQLAPADDPERIYRTVPWGRLAEVPVIDVRAYRDPAVDATDTETPEGAVALDPARTTLGAEQRAWLDGVLRSTEATWRVVGTPYNVLPVRLADRDTPERRVAEPEMVPNAGNYYPNEAFDDYQAERRDILQGLADDCVPNVVFVAGHTHVFLGGRLYPDYDEPAPGLPASPLVAHEFVCGSLTADPPPEGTYESITGQKVDRATATAALRAVESAGLDLNKHLDHINLVDQGYGLIEVTPDEVHVWFKVLDTFDPDATPTVSWEYRIPRGTTPSECPEPPTTTTAPTLPPVAPPPPPGALRPRFTG